MREQLRVALRAAAPEESVAVPEGLSWREAAVVIPILADGPEGPRLLVIRRPESSRTHAGQLAFPGGGQEAGETLVQTALRELGEELAIPADRVELLGSLRPTPTSSLYRVTPFVGWLEGEIAYRPAAAEVDRVIEVPLRGLIQQTRHWTERREYRGRSYEVHFYDYRGEVIWGATGQMLRDFLQRLAAVPAAKEL